MHLYVKTIDHDCAECMCICKVKKTHNIYYSEKNNITGFFAQMRSYMLLKKDNYESSHVYIANQLYEYFNMKYTFDMDEYCISISLYSWYRTMQYSQCNNVTQWAHYYEFPQLHVGLHVYSMISAVTYSCSKSLKMSPLYNVQMDKLNHTWTMHCYQ